jgi:phage replication initiation protein
LPALDSPPQAAITDWLNITFPFDPTPDNLAALLAQLAGLNRAFSWFGSDKGRLHKYEHSFQIGETSARLAYGGNAGTALLSFDGEACVYLTDWDAFARVFRDGYGARITRWDGAIDVHEGSPSVDDALAWHLQGAFNAGGRPPHCEKRGDWVNPNGRGRTLNIGLREHGKCLRVYEKGKQLGYAESAWVRWEVEMHHGKHRTLPWEVLSAAGQYVAGAYPKAMGWVRHEMARIKTIQKANEISVGAMVQHCARSYGKLIHLLQQQGHSAEAIVQMLSRAGMPARVPYPAQALVAK